MKRELLGNVGDTIAGVSAFAAVAQILPPLAAALAILWTLIRLYEWYRFRILGKRDKQGEVFK